MIRRAVDEVKPLEYLNVIENWTEELNNEFALRIRDLRLGTESGSD